MTSPAVAPFDYIPMSALASDSSTMTPAEWAVLKRVLSTSVRFLEYGCGDSTRLAAGCTNIRSIVSVESNPAFVDSALRTHVEIRQAEACGRLEFRLADIGPTVGWGKPGDDSKRHLWPAYALAPYRHGFIPDTILIDGRFRVACGLAAALQCPPSATILIHDYANRFLYFILENFLDVVEIADRLAVFHPKARFNQNRANRLLRAYLYEPRDADPRPFGRLRRYLRRHLFSRSSS